jgi:hypothetical protein
VALGELVKCLAVVALIVVALYVLLLIAAPA